MQERRPKVQNFAETSSTPKCSPCSAVSAIPKTLIGKHYQNSSCKTHIIQIREPLSENSNSFDKASVGHFVFQNKGNVFLARNICDVKNSFYTVEGSSVDPQVNHSIHH